MARISPKALEIAGFVLLVLGGLFAVLSTTTAHWKTVKTEKKDDTSSYHYNIIHYTSGHQGLFKICLTTNIKENDQMTYGFELCGSMLASSTKLSNLDNCKYDTVRAMMILGSMSVSSAILLFLVFKNKEKDPSIPVVVLGMLAAIFCMAGVAIYKKFLLYQLPKNAKAPKGWEKSPFGPKLGWSFYLACVAPALLLISSVLLAVNWKFCSKSREQPKTERHLMKTRS